MTPTASNQNSRLAAIVLSSEDAIISEDLDGIITSWNPAAETLFGFDANDAIGKPTYIMIPDEFLKEEKDVIAEIKKGKRISHYETVRSKKNGETFFASITVSPIKDDNDSIIGTSKIIRDMSDQRNNDQVKAELAAIIDSSDDAIISKNLNGVIQSWNAGAEKLFGYHETEAIGQHISIIIPDWKMYEEAEIIENIKNNKRVPHLDTIRKTKDGKLVNISVTISPIKNKKGIVIGASKIARDITERKELEKQRELFAKKLEDINHYKDEFMAMASHELKTPLTVVKSNLDLIKMMMEEESDEKVRFIDKSLAQIKKLSNLITVLLDVSKTQSGRLELIISAFDLQMLIEEVIESIQLTTTHDIKFIHKTDELIVNADKERIEQVLINLITNAIKYSPNASKIVITSSHKKDEIVVSIEDWGIGIPAKNISEVFTRFFRVPGISSTFSGTGIGLYISSEIIKKHKGKMWVESEESKGSVFYFTLPMATSE